MRSPRLLLIASLVTGCQQATPNPAQTDAAATPPADEVTSKEAPRKRVPFPEKPPRVGDTAPDFKLAQLGGGEVSLAELAPNGPVVLMFGSFS
jgi:hypothetical protein